MNYTSLNSVKRDLPQYLKKTLTEEYNKTFPQSKRIAFGKETVKTQSVSRKQREWLYEYLGPQVQEQHVKSSDDKICNTLSKLEDDLGQSWLGIDENGKSLGFT